MAVAPQGCRLRGTDQRQGALWEGSDCLLAGRTDLVFVMGVGTGESTLKQSKLIGFHIRIMA